MSTLKVRAARVVIACVLGVMGIACSNASASDSSLPPNSYWYCWDAGDLKPHHLGHYVPGDHICSPEELHSVGWQDWE